MNTSIDQCIRPLRIVIFAKAPRPGLAKSRLIPALGSDGAAALARRFLAHTLDTALAASVGTVELCVTPAMTDPIWQSLGIPTAVQLTDQGEGDLGERMARAARRVTGSGEAVLLIGTDCPGLGARELQAAAQSLQQCDATLFPAADGGYALLGLNRFHDSVFSDIAWSTDTVAFETLGRLGNLGWSVQSHPPLHDIDEPADLQWLPKDWLEDIRA